MKPEPQLNTELKLAHNFLRQQYKTYQQSNRIKSNDERRAWAHAIQIVGDIAYNYTITPRKSHRTPEFYNTIYDE